MTTDAKAGLALIVGSLAGLVTMSLHPTGHDIAANIASGGHATLNKAVHALALLAQPLTLLGTLALTLRFTTQRDLAVAAFVAFAMATVALMIAAVASGLVATGVLESAPSEPGPVRDAMLSAFHYTGQLNRAFAKVYVAFSSMAIILWSVAMLRGDVGSRGLGLYGLVSGGVLLLGIFTGYLRLNLHGFGLVVVGQAIWMIWVGAMLRRGH